jgi:hypothetical protein
MAKIGGILVSLLNATVMGVAAVTSKASKPWTLGANMSWILSPKPMSHTAWGRPFHTQPSTPSENLLDHMLVVDSQLAKLLTGAPMDVDPLFRALSNMKLSIRARVMNLGDYSAHEAYMKNVISCVSKPQETESLAFQLAWFLVRGASCLQGFGEPTDVDEFRRRVREALGRGKEQSTEHRFSEVVRVQKAPLPQQDNAYYDLTEDALYQDHEVWKAPTCT